MSRDGDQRAEFTHYARVAMQIVELPVSLRPMALNAAEMDFNDVANAAGWQPDLVAKFVELQMGALRALVKEIEAGGGVASGSA